MQKVMLLGLVLLAGLFRASAQNRNVLFIIVDDLKPLINAYGESHIHTPNLDRLIAKGVAFTNAHAQQAVCAPSRVSFITGMRPDHTQVWDLQTKMRDMKPDILTMPQYFARHGYTTVGMGKVLHGARKNDERSWTRPFVYDNDLDYAEGYGIPANFDYHNKESRKLYAEIKRQFPGDPNSDKVWLAVNREFKSRGKRNSTECLDVPDHAYTDGALARKGIEMMLQLSTKKKPFLLMIGFKKPHLPFVAPKKYWDLYNRDEIELAAFQKKAEGSPQYAYHNFGELRNYSDIGGSLTEDGKVMVEKQKELIHGYYACVSYVDAQVGLLLDHLDESGLESNTIVVLVGDHGWHLGDHGLWNKHTNYEQATRTPLMVYDPDLGKAVLNGSPVELIDIFPTLTQLTGIPTPAHLQGKSLVPLMTGESGSIKPVALSQYPRGRRMGYAVRDARYRYIEWHDGTDAQKGLYNTENILAVEIYDYEADPLEKVNVAHDPSYRETAQRLRNALRMLIEEG